MEINKHRKKIRKWKIFLFGIIFLASFIAIIPSIMAHCPLCTGATILGVGITRSLGWDDSIVGVFVGAMIVSSALWINNLLKKRNICGNSLLRLGSISTATFVLTIFGFYLAGLFGPGNVYRILGIERLTFGTLSGSVVSLVAFWISNNLKRKNNGKVLFNYQTMIITFAALIFNALVFWSVLK